MTSKLATEPPTKAEVPVKAKAKEPPVATVEGMVKAAETTLLVLVLIVISPLPNKDCPPTVFIVVPLTKAACFAAINVLKALPWLADKG